MYERTENRYGNDNVLMQFALYGKTAFDKRKVESGSDGVHALFLLAKHWNGKCIIQDHHESQAINKIIQPMMSLCGVGNCLGWSGTRHASPKSCLR